MANLIATSRLGTDNPAGDHDVWMLIWMLKSPG
jgi:hypothetical protein